jgi:catechol 2,3-dioxygenase-like lactoylglutathione lyase family enzyme
MGPRRQPVSLHHVELWVPDLAGAEPAWGWLLTELGWQPFQHWERGRSWRSGEVYLVIEESTALTGRTHDRCAPGLNHLAFHAGPPPRVDELVAAAPEHGWSPLFPERYPHAGGPDHYAAYLVDSYGYEVELVAVWPTGSRERDP